VLLLSDQIREKSNLSSRVEHRLTATIFHHSLFIFSPAASRDRGGQIQNQNVFLLNIYADISTVFFHREQTKVQTDIHSNSQICLDSERQKTKRLNSQLMRISLLRGGMFKFQPPTVTINLLHF